MEEIAHLPAGISHWHFGRFDLHMVNPPFVRMVAALPVVVCRPKTDWSHYQKVLPTSRPEWKIGNDFIAANKDRALWYFTLARWACIPFSLIGGFVCYRWARSLYGDVSGIVALLFWCFSPDVLGHAATISTDLAAASMSCAACFTFSRWLPEPGGKRAVVAGILLGLAILSKNTCLVLVPLWIVLWLIFAVSRWSTNYTAVSGWQLVVLLLIALYAVNLNYGFEGSFRRLGDYEFISRTLSGLPYDAYETGNRFRHTPLASMPVPVPQNWLLGVDMTRRDLMNSNEQRLTYFRGRHYPRGFWYMYLYAAAVKVPLGLWGLCLLRLFQNRRRAWARDELLLLLPALTILALISCQTGYVQGSRYALPTHPFLFIWAAGAFASPGLVSRLVGIPMVSWFIASSLSVYPHSLSYFNELGGGPTRGHYHLIHSDVDWGQDLIELRSWLAEHQDSEPLFLAYYGAISPAHLGITFQVPPLGELTEQGSRPQHLPPGWYAVSVNMLRGEPANIFDGSGGAVYLPHDALSSFRDFKCHTTIGYSIYIYDLRGEPAK